MTTFAEAKKYILNDARDSLDLEIEGDELLNIKVDLLYNDNIVQNNITLSDAIDYLLNEAKDCSDVLAKELYRDAVKEFEIEEPIGAGEKDIIYYDIRLSGDDDSEGGYINIGYNGQDDNNVALNWFKEIHSIM